MKNLKKVALISFATITVTAITFLSSDSEFNVLKSNDKEEVSATDNIQLTSIDWSDYDINTATSTEGSEAGKCGEEKKKSEAKTETKKESEKCGEGKCGEGKCGDDKKKSETKTEKETEKKSEKCGTGKCGVA